MGEKEEKGQRRGREGEGEGRERIEKEGGEIKLCA